MAIVKGVNERVHLPLYDSLFVRPARQLRELASSNVLKFFVDIQGKTKLETNMQSASLLPHWNTFEARALRVVISDLSPTYPQSIESCLRESSSCRNGDGRKYDACFDDIDALLDDYCYEVTYQTVAAARESLTALRYAAEPAREVSDDIEACLGLLRRFCDPNGLGRILKMQSNLRSIREDLAAVLRRTRVTLTKEKEVTRFLEELEALEPKGEEYDLLRRLGDAKACLEAFVQLVEFSRRLKAESLTEIDTCVGAASKLADTAQCNVERLNHLKYCLAEAVAEIGALKARLKHARSDFMRQCLNEAISDKLLLPLDEQLFGTSPQILAKLIYNSVTTLFVGEKTMIQMPTWFFPAGAGPFSEDGHVATHGVPTPQATFNFAEPVFIDTQQNFRVEIEFPEAGSVSDVQRIYGPFLIWVVLDGYMTRDVQ
jgi:hypothetical protein